METNEVTQDVVVIDIGELLNFFLRRAVYILLSGLVLAVLTYGITTFFITPSYTSVTKMYVLNRQTNESITNSDIQSSTYLTKDYMEMIKSRTVIEAVIAELDLDMTYDQLLSALSVSTTSDTRVVAISVTNSDPYLARDIANAIRRTAAAHIQAVMNTEAVNVVDEANIPSVKSGPKVKRDVMIAGFAGIVLALIVNFVLFLMNDKVTTAEDVERHLRLSVLAQMPLEMDEVKKKKARKKLEKKKKRGSSFK